MTDPGPVVELPGDAFPFTVELLDAETRQVLWSAVVADAGGLSLPAADDVNPGRESISRVTFPGGPPHENPVPRRSGLNETQ